SRSTMGMTPFELFESGFYAFGNGLPWLLGGLGIYGIFKLRGRGPGLLIFLIAGIVGLSLIVNAAVHFLFHVRHLLILGPLLALLAGFALAQLHRFHKTLPAILLTLWIIPGIYHSLDNQFVTSLRGSMDTMPMPSFGHMLTWVEDHAPPPDAVFFQIAQADAEKMNQVVLNYYLYETDVHYAQYNSVSIFEDDDNADLSYTERVRQFVDDAPHIWLVTTARDYPHVAVQKVIDEIDSLEYQYCGRAWENQDFHIDVYSQQSCATLTALPHYPPNTTGPTS
ncbi:MAG: hypothetical protein K8S97_07735, partial [Anaerolineae bacterium]|nr:hypothetical protein [Anaerolineae bacterium]